MTIFSWYGPWAWPAWPALTVLRLAFGGNDAWWTLSFGARSLLLTLLIAINVSFWGFAAFGVLTSRDGFRRRKR